MIVFFSNCAKDILTSQVKPTVLELFPRSWAIVTLGVARQGCDSVLYCGNIMKFSVIEQMFGNF